MTATTQFFTSALRRLPPRVCGRFGNDARLYGSGKKRASPCRFEKKESRSVHDDER
ncbi:hypothetical protein M4V62_00320 [Streptomyces durmitorensis]|uniref:Uncharacterized protein n=1 Tax=Streptomyces durmitorensis TaxID=319947 RepID=A0ABY4PKJ2_9ACTN|nr:hypothetical protein [Streptomyces durmitorensis]UQT53650.1 hypothetical protein M4V62_00320 [Streptomyces durmitorensis]